MTQSKSINIEKDVNIHLENKRISRGFFWFLWVVYSVVFMTKNCYNGSLASIVSEGVLTKSQTGAITAMFYLVYTPMQVLGGVFADKYSPERMLKIGLIGAAISNTVVYLCQNYYVMFGAWIFNGIIQFGIWPSIFKIISSQLVRSERSRMSFYISFSATAGCLISYVLAAIVTNWRYNFAISAVSLFVLALTFHIYEKYITPYMKWDRAEEYNEINEDSINKSTDVSMLKIFAASGFFFMLFGTILSTTVSQTRSGLTSVMLMENYKSITPSLGNILTAIMIVAGMAGTLFAGKFIKNVKNEVTFVTVLSIAELPFLLGCIFIGILPVSAMIAMLSIIACLDAVMALTRNYYTMYFAKYGLSGTAAGILNAGVAFSYMLAAYVMPRIAESFGWKILLISLPIMICFAILSFSLIIRYFAKFKSRHI